MTSVLSNKSAGHGGVDPISTKTFNEEMLVVAVNAITDDEAESANARTTLI